MDYLKFSIPDWSIISLLHEALTDKVKAYVKYKLFYGIANRCHNVQ